MEDKVKLARIRAMQDNVLPVLIARAGGSVTVTEAEVDEVASRFGGFGRMTIRTEVVDGALRLTLLDTEPPAERLA